MADAGFVPSLIGTSGETLREAFGKALANVAAKYPALVVLDADVAGGTGTHHFRRAHPDRVRAARDRRTEHGRRGRRHGAGRLPAGGDHIRGRAFRGSTTAP